MRPYAAESSTKHGQQLQKIGNTLSEPQTAQIKKNKILNNREYLLLTPGPVNVAENIRLAIRKSDICHREVDFDLLLQRVERKLLSLFEISNTSKYRAVVITGSGTAANESLLSSVIGQKNILILSNGEFGERLFAISKIYNEHTALLNFPWGEKLEIKKLEHYLKQNNIDVLMMVHHETSSGILNSLENIGALAKSYGILFMVDCVSSAGAQKIDMEKNQIAFCSSSSSKAIASYPGLSFVIGEKKAFEDLKELPIKSGYLNLYKFYNCIKTISQTPNTPAVPLFYALEQALDNILNKGIAKYYLDLQNKANFLRNGMLALGLKFLINQDDMSSVLTTVYCPKNITLDIFSKLLREKSIIIYQGKGCFKDKFFQVGSIGELSFQDLQFFLDTLKTIFIRFKQLNINEGTLIQINTRIVATIKTKIQHDSHPTKIQI